MFKFSEHTQKWWILVAMTTCISMTFIDSTVLPVALPTIQKTLNISEAGLQWIVNAYMLALTVFVLAGGRLGDRFGHRKGFCWGLLLFSVGSVLCGFSYSTWWFIVARIIQGMGGSLLIPASAAIIFAAFPVSQRGKAMGIYVGVGSVFLTIAPFIGGVLTQYLSWRFIFWINIPIALIGLLLTLISVPETKGEYRPFDTFGFIFSTIGFAAIITALMQGDDWGWSSTTILGLLACSVVLLTFLLTFDRKIEHPYIDTVLFKNRNFTGSILAIFCTGFLLMLTIFWTLYFQIALDYTPARAGVLNLIANSTIIISAPLAGHLLDKFGPRVPITAGFLIVIGSLFWFLQNLENRSMAIILSTMVPFGFAIPLITTPSMTTALAEVIPEKRGIASATATMLRQLAATFGLAFMSSAFLTTQNLKFSHALKQNVMTESLNPKQFQGLLSDNPQALSSIAKLPEQAQKFVQENRLDSYIFGFWEINVIGLVTAVAGLVLALWLIKRKRTEGIQL